LNNAFNTVDMQGQSCYRYNGGNLHEIYIS